LNKSWTSIEIVDYDDDFWQNEMAQKLEKLVFINIKTVLYIVQNLKYKIKHILNNLIKDTTVIYHDYSFFMNCLLPELINPQYGKRLLVSDIKDRVTQLPSI